MPDVTVKIGDREFEVACQEGEEHYLRSAAALLDAEAQSLVSSIRHLTESRMLLMAGLMLADKSAGIDDTLKLAERKIADLEARVAEAEVRRAEADARLADGGLAAMIAELDPKTAARTDLRNPARVQRAWEVGRATGRGLAAWHADTGAALLPLEQAHPFLLWPDRDWLAGRIDARFGQMLEDGALDEVRAVLPIWDPAALWAKAIGAPELVAHLRGDLPLDVARLQAQAASRQYAKRQRTWFRRRMRDWTTIALP